MSNIISIEFNSAFTNGHKDGKLFTQEDGYDKNLNLELFALDPADSDYQRGFELAILNS